MSALIEIAGSTFKLAEAFALIVTGFCALYGYRLAAERWGLDTKLEVERRRQELARFLKPHAVKEDRHLVTYLKYLLKRGYDEREIADSLESVLVIDYQYTPEQAKSAVWMAAIYTDMSLVVEDRKRARQLDPNYKPGEWNPVE